MTVGGKTPELWNETFGEANDTDQGHLERLSRYGRAKSHQAALSQSISEYPDLCKEYEALQKCGQMLIFQHWLQSNYRKLVGGFSCKKHLLCWPCALRRDSRQIRDYTLKVQQILFENSALIPVLITRTVKNGPDLKERFKHLQRIHKALMRWRRQSKSNRCTARGRSADSVMQYVAGSVGTYEFKRGEGSGDWHPHIHEVAFLEPVFVFSSRIVPGWKKTEDGFNQVDKEIWVPVEFQRRLSEEYKDISGDSYIVDVRRIEIKDLDSFTNDDPVSSGSDGLEPDYHSVAKALCEVFKYALKFSEMTHEDQIHAYKVLKGKRLIFSYGCLRGVKVSDNLVDSAQEELEIGPYVYELYTFAVDSYQFSKHLSNEEFEEMQEDAALQGRMENLRRREERLEEGKSVLLENGLRIDREYVDKSGVKSFWKGFSLPHMGHDLECRSAVNDQMLEWQKQFIPF